MMCCEENKHNSDTCYWAIVDEREVMYATQGNDFLRSIYTSARGEAIEENRSSKTEIAAAVPLRRLSGGASTST